MISSMTGFARETIVTEFGTLSIELRSINHRYLETYFKLPEILRAYEPAFRDQTQNRLRRGKLEVMMRLESTGSNDEHLVFNENLAKNVMELHRQANQLLGTNHNLSPMDLIRFPNMLATSTPDPETLEKTSLQLFDTALQSLMQNRQGEGSRILAVIDDRLSKIDELTKKHRFCAQKRPNVYGKSLINV